MQEGFFIGNDNDSYQWIDGDTFIGSDAKAYRLKGYDTREIDKIIGDGVEDDEEPRFVAGHRLGKFQTGLVTELQKRGDFTNIVKTGETDKYGRELVTLVNSNGEDFGNTLLANNLVEVNQYTSEEALQARSEARMMNEMDGANLSPYADLSASMQGNIAAEGYNSKTLATNEASYDPDIHYGVQNRAIDRTLDNKAKGFSNQVGAAWETGWDGVKEGLYGYADALGQVTGIEMLENMGEQGVARAKQRMAEAPEIVTSYKDVGGVFDGFQWVINNAVMSSPYLIGTFAASMAAGPVSAIAGPTAGLVTAVTPMSVTYAGQTWNEMEGEKGVSQFLAASTAGVAMATLDRLGMQALMPYSDLLKPSGVNKLVAGYNQKYLKGKNEGLARRIVTGELRKNQGEFARGLARLKADDFAKFSSSQVAKSAGVGAASEGVTELAQETLQMGTAALTSDTEYGFDQIQERLINAGLAGSTLGGTIGGGANAYRQSINQLVKRDLSSADPNRKRMLENKRMQDIQTGGYINTVQENIKNRDNEHKNNLPDFKSLQKSRAKNNQVSFNGELTKSAALHEKNKRGITNTFKDAKDLKDYLGIMAEGAGKLIKAAELNMIGMSKLVDSNNPYLLDAFSRIGQETTGQYHIGPNAKQYNDSLISQYKAYINEKEIANSLGKPNLFGRRVMSQANAILISNKIKDFATKKDSNGKTGLEKYATIIQKEKTQTLTAKEKEFYNENAKLYETANSFRKSYQQMQNELESAGVSTVKDPNYFFKAQGFDYSKVKRDPEGFKNWLRMVFPEKKNDFIENIYEKTVHRGERTYKGFSLVAGSTGKPDVFTKEKSRMLNDPRFKDWSSNNMFEELNKSQLEIAKHISTREYFGEGGFKLDHLIGKAKELENSKPSNDRTKLSNDEINQFAWYAKSIIDSTHGNYSRVENPKLAAMNRYLTSWSIFVGLPLATLSSVPETAMIWFNVHNDKDFKKATGRLMEQITQAWDDKAQQEVDKAIKALDRSALSYSQNAVVDRLATGDRDIGFLKAHETFFKIIGIKDITQLQRRMNAAFALDYVKSAILDLDTAPKKMVSDGIENIKPGFDFDKFNEIESRAYSSLADLGIDVEVFYDMVKDLDDLQRDQALDITDDLVVDAPKNDRYLKGFTQRQLAFSKLVDRNEFQLDGTDKTLDAFKAEITMRTDFIDEQIQSAIYRFVNERIQNPRAANRPLFFQDPHYQLLTQFNGFISTFTANVVPKLWNNQLRKGTPKVKYDVFLLIVTMIALGGASQLLKDILKFGAPSPYLDNAGYMQRALYSAGVLGQFERVVDVAAPLYPERSRGLDWLFGTVVGEAGPSVRVLSNAAESVTNLAKGETQRAVNSALKSTPFIAPFTGPRQALSRGAVGKDLYSTKEFDYDSYKDKYNIDNLLF